MLKTNINFLFFSIFIFYILYPLSAKSKDNNNLAPLSNAVSIFINYDENSLYSISFEKLKAYLENKFPHMTDIKELPLSKDYKYGMGRKITYKIKNEKTIYQEPNTYILFFYPKRVKTDINKIHEIILNDPDYGHAILKLYESIKIAS